MNRAAYRLGRVVSIPRAEWCVACRRHSSAAPPSLHAGVAITVPRSGALLTGLATAVASVPAVILCPRRYHCPLAGCFFLMGISCANRSLFSQGLRGAAPRARQGKAPADAGVRERPRTAMRQLRPMREHRCQRYPAKPGEADSKTSSVP